MLAQRARVACLLRGEAATLRALRPDCTGVPLTVPQQRIGELIAHARRFGHEAKRLAGVAKDACVRLIDRYMPGRRQAPAPLEPVDYGPPARVPEGRRIYATIDRRRQDDELARLVDWIEGRKGSSVTVRELQRSPRGYREPGQAKAALERLAEDGFGVLGFDPVRTGGGHQPLRFTLFPRRGDGDTRPRGDSDSGASVITTPQGGAA